MFIACLDFESVLIPEIWPALAKQTGIKELMRTTKEEPSMDRLMGFRLDTMREHKLGLADLQAAITKLEPLPGAASFVDWVRKRFQLIIVSDTFYELAGPFITKLGYPTIFCHKLTVDKRGVITDYVLRQPDPKRMVVKALHSINFRCLATGDSYNDVGMLAEADYGVLFKPPANVVAEFPQFPVARSYAQLKQMFSEAAGE